MGFNLPFTIDFSFWLGFLDMTLYEQFKVLFGLFGWIVLAVFFIKAGAELWAEYRTTTRGTKDWKWVVLAVDVPPLFIQTPKAVEQIFAHLSGAHGHTNVADKFWHGKKQKSFSFEIISIEGYIQFLIRTEVEYRDLVEASIYAQYPEAEITEVEDYVNNIPDHYPNDSYDVMGVEFQLAQPDAYPIRTYSEFEYSLSKEAVFSDPMAALLENFTRIGRGENLWMHLIVEPTDNSWKEKGIEIVKGLMGEEVHHHGGGIWSAILSIPMTIFKELLANVGFGGGDHGHEEAHGEKKKDLSPGTKKTVEAIEDKIGKIGFKSKIRLLYAAQREAYHPSRCVEGFVGAMNQFHEMNRNAIVPAAETHAHYDRHHVKSNKMKTGFVKTFKGRKLKWGKVGGYVLNIEELATVWHFPLPFVKTPLLQKAGHKRSEPPSGLPVEMTESPLKRIQPYHEPPKIAPENHPPLPPAPEDLPYG